MQKRTTKRAAARKPAKKTTSRKTAKETKPAPKTTRKSAAPKAEKPKRPRDPRLPAPGTTLVRPYKGKDYAVTVLEDTFEWEGQTFTSLSKLASAITGQASINGFLWARLTEPKERPAKATKKTTRKRAAKKAEPAAAPTTEVADAE